MYLKLSLRILAEIRKSDNITSNYLILKNTNYLMNLWKQIRFESRDKIFKPYLKYPQFFVTRLSVFLQLNPAKQNNLKTHKFHQKNDILHTDKKKLLL